MDLSKFAVGVWACLILAFGAFAQSGLDLNAVDKSANPCNDFYQYACGSWLKTHPIPPDEASWGRFNELQQRNQEILRGILEDSEKHQNASSIDQKIGGFYQSCMNEQVIADRGSSRGPPS